MKRALTAVAVMLAVGTAAGLAILWPGHTETRLAGRPRSSTPRRRRSRRSPRPRARAGRAALPAGNGAAHQRSGHGQADPAAAERDPGLRPRPQPRRQHPRDQGARAAARASGRSPARTTRSTTSSAARRCSCFRCAFIAVVVLFGRLRGALSLVGLGISLALVLLFVVPAILDGKSPVGSRDRRFPCGRADHDPTRPRRAARRRSRPCWARRRACCSRPCWR